jgi:hypothetical protein
VHILSPNEPPATNVLEEGLAPHFANRYLNEQKLVGGRYDPGLDSYRDAQAQATLYFASMATSFADCGKVAAFGRAAQAG